MIIEYITSVHTPLRYHRGISPHIILHEILGVASAGPINLIFTLLVTVLFTCHLFRHMATIFGYFIISSNTMLTHFLFTMQLFMLVDWHFNTVCDRIFVRYL